MHQEHQAGVAQFAGHRQTHGGCKPGLLEATLHVDLAAAAGEGGITERRDFAEDAIAAPAFRQRIWLHEGIKLVPGVGDALRRQGHTDGRTIGQGFSEQQGVAGADGGPLGQPLQLDATDGALQFGEAKVGAEALVYPAEAGGMLSLEDRLMGFAVVFEGPHGVPEIGMFGCDHAALAGGGEDLVLAEAPGGHIAEAAHGLSMDAGAMGLGTVFDHGETLGAGQIEDRGHVGGPAAEVHHRDGLGAGGDQRRDRVGGDGTAFSVNIGEHRLGAEKHGAGSGGDKSARRSDQFIAGAQADGQIGSRESQGAIGHGDGVGGAAPAGVLLLKSSGLLTGPGVHLAGGEHAGGDVDLLGVELGPGSEGHAIKSES